MSKIKQFVVDFSDLLSILILACFYLLAPLITFTINVKERPNGK